MQIELNEAEAVMLRDLLEVYLSDLRMEIAGTENMDYREKLKRQELFLDRLLERLAR